MRRDENIREREQPRQNVVLQDLVRQILEEASLAYPLMSPRMSIDHWMRRASTGGAPAASSPGAPDDTHRAHHVPSPPDCSIPGVRPDLSALNHWTDPAAKPPAKKLDPVAQVQENLKELEATRHAQTLVSARGDVDNEQARYELLNTLDKVSDPDMRHRMMAKFSEATGQSLEEFIQTADWDGGRDKEEALRLISPERDAAAEKIKAMSPDERKKLEGKANDWAQRVLAVTRIEDADSDTAAADIFRTLGPRSPEEVEMIRAAVRRNTGGHGIYEELDRSLSGNTEDEAVAGLSGDPVQAAWAGLKNVDDNPGRSIEILRGLTPAQRQELISKKAIFGTGWILNGIPEGADREEVRHLLANDTVGADGEHFANLLRDPMDGARLENMFAGVDKTAQTKKFEAARATSNVIKEFESKSPEELLAAKEAFNKNAAERGGPSWDQMLDARFRDGDPTTYMRMQALSRGDRAESRALGFRVALEAGNQPELERVLASPDLKSDDPIKRAAAEKERNELANKIEAFDAQQKYAQAVLRGENPGDKQFAGREVTEQIEQHFTDEAASNAGKARVDQMRDVAKNGIVLADGFDSHVAKRNETTRDNKYATEEVWKDGKVAASTEVRRAEKDKQTEKKLGMLENLKSNEQLSDIGADYQRKYGKDMLAAPDQAAFHAKAAYKKSQGDPRPITEILSDVARNELDANQLRLEHLREYGTKADRRPDVQLKLQHELYDKQFSQDLHEQELVRVSAGGNFGTQDLARSQLAAQDEMLEEKQDPYGILPRDLKPGVDREQYDQIDRNLTSTLEVQREEKVKLAEKNTRIFTVIAMIGSIAIANPALTMAFNAALQMTKIKMKRDIAGEAYDDSGDAGEFLTNLVMDGAMVGAAQFGRMLKGAKGMDAASDAARIGEHSATELAEHAVTTEAREEVIEQAVKQTAPDAVVFEKQASRSVDATLLANSGSDAAVMEAKASSGADAATDAKVANSPGNRPRGVEAESGGRFDEPSLGVGMTSEPIAGPPMDPERFGKMKSAFERQGGIVAQDAEAQAYLKAREASAVTLNESTMVLGEAPTASEVFEEFIHTAQYRTGRATGANVVEMEIEAAEKLIRNRRAWGIAPVETQQTIARLRRLRQQLVGQLHEL